MKQFKNAVGYIRVSTKAQAEDDKYGIDTQKQEILLYANENGYNIVEWFIEQISGSEDDRPVFDDQIINGGMIMNPPIEAVITFKSDRVARNMKLYFYYLYMLEKRNIKLLSVREDFGGNEDLANLYRAILQFVAEQERKNIALRTGKGRSIKASCGGYSGGQPPFGYKVQNGRLVIEPYEAEIVEKVFTMLDRGTTLVDTAEWLNDNGYHTRIGKKFYASNIRSIKNNRPVYEGMYKYGKGAAWVKGVHEPILKGEE